MQYCADRRPMRPMKLIEFEGLALDQGSHRVLVGERTVALGPTEYRMLEFFMTHPERVYTRDQLLDRVWGGNVYVEERTIDVHIRRLAQGARGIRVRSLHSDGARLRLPVFRTRRLIAPPTRRHASGPTSLVVRSRATARGSRGRTAGRLDARQYMGGPRRHAGSSTSPGSSPTSSGSNGGSGIEATPIRPTSAASGAR